MGHKIAIHLVVEYDVKEVIPLLMIIFPWLNLIVQSAQAIILIDGYVFEGENEKSFMGIGYWWIIFVLEVIYPYLCVLMH